MPTNRENHAFAEQGYLLPDIRSLLQSSLRHRARSCIRGNTELHLLVKKKFVSDIIRKIQGGLLVTTCEK